MRPSYLDQSSFHRYRINVIAQWPESEYKQAALRAARAALLRDQAFQSAGDYTAAVVSPGR